MVFLLVDLFNHGANTLASINNVISSLRRLCERQACVRFYKNENICLGQCTIYGNQSLWGDDDWRMMDDTLKLTQMYWSSALLTQITQQLTIIL